MQASRVLIAWTPTHYAATSECEALRRTAGSVAILPWPDLEGRAQSYARTAGASNAGWREASDHKLVAAIFVVFNAMVLRDGVHPMTAHVNLLDIDEYRDNVHADLNQQRALPLRTAEIISFDHARASLR